MINKNIEGPEVSALGILFVGIVILGAIVAMPFVYHNVLSEEVETGLITIKQLKIQKRKISQNMQSNQTKTLQSSLGDKLLLSGGTTGITGANLQKLVADLVKRYNGEPRSFQVLTPEKEKNLTRISVSLSMTVNISSLQKIIFALETRTPLIFIEDIVVRTTSNKKGALGGSLQSGRLDVTMKVSGFIAKADET